MKNKAKQMLLIMLSMIALSCGSNSHKEESEIAKKNPVDLKYTIKLESNWLFTHNERLGAEIKVFEYTENGDRIFQNEIILTPGNSQTFKAQSNTQKIKVYVISGNPLGRIMNTDFQGWLPLVYYLSPDEIKVISIDNNVTLYRSEP